MALHRAHQMENLRCAVRFAQVLRGTSKLAGGVTSVDGLGLMAVSEIGKTPDSAPAGVKVQTLLTAARPGGAAALILNGFYVLVDTCISVVPMRHRACIDQAKVMRDY